VILRVLSDVIQAVDKGDVVILALLNLSAAFDTVDLSVLPRRLQITFGFDGTALQRFRSCISGRMQAVRRVSQQLVATAVPCGIPQGSVLEPILFIMYTPDLVKLIERHGLSSHLYADDTHVSGHCSSATIGDLAARVAACSDDLLHWMQSHRLLLNADKTQFILCATSRRLHQLPVTSTRVGSVTVLPSSSVQDLGIYTDANLSMQTHVQQTVAGRFAVLRQIRSIRRSLPPTVLQTLVMSFVLSRLDYGNAALVGIPAYLLRRMQSVLKAVARSVACLPRLAHKSTLLAG
jgi:hypothetical protein